MDADSFELTVAERLPIVMPGEEVPSDSRPFACYDPDGQLLSDDPIDSALLMASWERRREHHFETTLAYRGKSFWISTVWLAANHNYDGGPPLVWETMAQSDDWLDFTHRYSTSAAARNGHLTIVSILLSAGMTLVESNVEIPAHQVHTIIAEEEP